MRQQLRGNASPNKTYEIMRNDKFFKLFTIKELKSIRDKWHEIDNQVKTTPLDELEYGITYEDAYYADRDICTDLYTMRITTYKKEDNKTVLSDVIILYDDECEVGEFSIDKIEDIIKTWEAE